MVRKHIAAFITAITLMVMAMFAAIAPAHAQTTAASGSPTASTFTKAFDRKQAQPSNERILNYDINAVIAKDGKMTVTERLTVNVENRRIRHGITRTYPIAMRYGDDKLYRFTFDVISTKLDGKPVDHKMDKDKMIAGMALGSAKTFVPKGIHTYEIVYETEGHVLQLEKLDEIYYNAVGLDVVFPIDKATFTLTLPDSTKPLITKAFTGRRGQRGTDYKMTGAMAFETTRILNPNEGFTVVVGWKKGIVVPTYRQAWVSAHRNVAFAIIIGAVILALAILWFWYFRKKTPPIYPIFTPPADLSPGEAAYIDNGGKYVPLMLQADLMWSAVQGFCKLDFSKQGAPAFIFSTKHCPHCGKALENPDQTTCPHCLKATASGRKTSSIDNQKNNQATKAKPGRSLAGTITYTLFSAVTRIVMGTDKKSGKAHSSLTEAWNSLYKYYKPKLRKLTEGRYLPALWAWLIGQIGLFLILDDIWYASKYTTPYMIGIPLLALGFAAFCLFVAWGAWTGMAEILWRYGICAVAIIFAGAALWAIWVIFAQDIILTGTYLLLYALPMAFVWKWHTIRNTQGIEKLKTTEGLKMYINTAEKHRLEIINAPDDTVEQYETILPYAIALGCADAWEKRFAPVLAQINYIPGWVHKDSYAIYRPADYETWDERQRRLHEERMRRQMFTSVVEAPVSVENAIKEAITESQQTRTSVSSGGGGGWLSGGGGSSGGSSGSSGGGSGGGGVGGW